MPCCFHPGMLAHALCCVRCLPHPSLSSIAPQSAACLYLLQGSFPTPRVRCLLWGSAASVTLGCCLFPWVTPNALLTVRSLIACLFISFVPAQGQAQSRFVFTDPGKAKFLKPHIWERAKQGQALLACPGSSSGLLPIGARGVGVGAGSLLAMLRSPQVSHLPAAQPRRGKWFYGAGVHKDSLEGKMGMRAG